MTPPTERQFSDYCEPYRMCRELGAALSSLVHPYGTMLTCAIKIVLLVAWCFSLSLFLSSIASCVLLFVFRFFLDTLLCCAC